MKLLNGMLIFKKHHKLSTDQVKRHDKMGFTLVELLIAVAILSILAAVLVPASMSVLPDYRLKKATRNLLSDMQRARLNAIKNGIAWRVDFDEGAETYTIRDPGNDRIMGNADDRLTPTNVTNYGSGVHLPPSGSCGNATGIWTGAPIDQPWPLSVPVNTVSFTSRGTCEAGSVFLSNQDNTICYAVTTTAACAIKIRKYNGMTPFNTNNWIE